MPVRNRVTVKLVTRLPDFQNIKMVFEPATLEYRGSFLIVIEPEFVEVPHKSSKEGVQPYLERVAAIKRTVFPSHEVQYAREDIVPYEET